ncbi:hypothetical protein LOK74_10350 [Brevibacillus humidisoli]|uniref:hypothetical protein n=1 Tax=Brevibacillus humidisoli TaxID=2895522 RepID=UPI001E62399F|nr:hypothetical protein [Brevibacillus humidisoli]UFJ42858.1 hypothetical protein LOK74_10350 [Brevibacillus humidisoli]
MQVSEDSILIMHELQSREENEEEILIGRPDVSNYIVPRLSEYRLFICLIRERRSPK